jgi:two-component system response regulator ResD
MEKILVIDDDPEIRKLIKDFLKKENYSVDTASGGNSALDLIVKNPAKYHLIVLDLMLPDISGIEICRQIRKFSNIPVIMLTAKSEDEDKIEGLETGADDYITKPFNPKELVARIKALVRRSRAVYSAKPENTSISENIFSGGTADRQPENILISFRKSASLKNKVVDKLIDQLSQKLNPASTSSAQKTRTKDLLPEVRIEIHPKARKVFVDGSEIRLTNKEFSILLYFLKNKNIVISREKLLEDIWGFDFIGESRTIDVHIKELRKKIKDINGDLIETIWSVGYRFNSDIKDEYTG